MNEDHVEGGRERLWETHFNDLLNGNSASDRMPSLDEVLDFSREKPDEDLHKGGVAESEAGEGIVS